MSKGVFFSVDVLLATSIAMILMLLFVVILPGNTRYQDVNPYKTAESIAYTFVASGEADQAVQYLDQGNFGQANALITRTLKASGLPYKIKVSLIGYDSNNQITFQRWFSNSPPKETKFVASTVFETNLVLTKNAVIIVVIGE